MDGQCKHPRPRLYEEQSGEAVYEFENGKVVSDYRRDYGPTGVWFVHCPACGLGRRYQDNAKRAPKWVRELIAQVSS